MAASSQGLPQPPPGMSVYAAKRVIGEAQWNAEQLEQVYKLNWEDELALYVYLFGKVICSVFGQAGQVYLCPSEYVW